MHENRANRLATMGIDRMLWVWQEWCVAHHYSIRKPPNLAPRFCQCGCRQEYQPTSRNQKFNPACYPKAHSKATMAAYKRKAEARAKGGEQPLPPRKHVRMPLGASGITSRPKMCLLCCNLSHARSFVGCPNCGLPWAP